ncbi:EAL domain-containing protein [Tundrisphaera lichenicola]|uniref:EAL domain-containing protein n=1 Tax=Tundrisphaera lichenicola TaxID=2029860 RepID=UPI003EBB9E02
MIHLLDTMPLSTMIAKIKGDWLVEMIREERMTSHFQPIVRTESPGEVYAYECLLRGLDLEGSLIAPKLMYDSARNAELLFHLDRAARLTAIREAVRLGIRERLFINFNPSSVYDPAYCLKTTIAAIDEAGFAPDRIVFEVVESDQSGANLLRILETYRKAGFRVALDDLGAGYGSLNLLSQLRPDVAKLDIQLIRDVHLDPYQANITAHLLEMAHKLGIETVAEGIESAEEFEWFRDHGATYIQGYYIARPASPPPRPRQLIDPPKYLHRVRSATQSSESCQSEDSGSSFASHGPRPGH